MHENYYHQSFKFWLLWVFVVMACPVTTASGARADAFYGQRIVAPTAGGELKAAIEDAVQTLQKMTGREFAVAPEYTGSGIWLLRTDSAQAPADAKQQLEGKGREPFIIRSNDKERLLIIANREPGLIHGLYFYLEQLGARFYFPTDNWTIVPQKNDITIQIDRLMAPDFRLRSFFGTGGFGRLPIDPKRTVQASWETWKRRNRFGGEYSLGGHSGEAFNLEKKAILLEHPEYLAKVNGQH
ncbi:MAG TPA: hypothetical protein VNA16_08095, partial [Abditibacteriaceae bacterium]|nr:hypothetical protein [Abditibacteriaceae bacterium]